MRKLFVSALAIVSMVACTMDETVNTQAPASIAFDGAFVEKATRAEDPSTTTDNINEFYVWAVMNDVDGLVFNGEAGEKVWKSGNAWTYQNIQYWVPNNHYYFTALAGNLADVELALTADNGMTSLKGLTNSAVFTNVEGTNDLLYAEYDVETPAVISAAPAKVKFQFAHLLSKVKFTFANGFVNKNTTVVVKDITMAVPATGEIDLTADELAWANQAGNLVLAMGHMNGGENLAVNASESSDNERLTIPATAAQEYIVKFTVEIWNGAQMASSTPKEVKIAGVELKPGHSYNFKATLNQDNAFENPLFPIEFEAEVENWVEGDFDLGNLAENNVVVYNEDELKAALNTTESVNVIFGQDITASEVIYVSELANLTTTINGNGHKFVGAFRINGHSAYANATTVFENIKFETADASALHDSAFIYCGGGNGDTNRYPDNVTIKNCSFTATGAAVEAAVAAKFWSLNGNLVVENCQAEALHSLLQLTSCGEANVTVDGVAVANGKNGISLGNAGKTVIKNANISAREYGVRANGCKAHTTIEASTIKANQPVIVRNVTVDGYVLNVDDATVLTPGGHYDVIFTAKSDDVAYEAPSKSFTCNAPETLMVYPLVVVTETAEELAACLKADSKAINVVLANDIELPISSLGQITGGSGEYKLGGENTETITIDLNGKLLNVTTTYWSNLGAKNDNAIFTIKNGKMTSSQLTGTWNSYDLCFSNCNYNFEDVVFEKAIALGAANKAFNLKNVTINETHDYYAMWVEAVGQTVTIDGLTVNSAGRGIKIDEQYVSAPAKVTMNIANATFTTAKKAAILVKSVAGAEINAENLNIAAVAADADFAVWVDSDAAAYADQVVVNGAYCKVEGVAATIVDSASALTAALNDSAVSAIVLAAGDYGVVVTKSNKTIIGSNDANVDAVVFNGSENVTIKNIVFDAATAQMCYDGSGKAKQYALVMNDNNGGKNTPSKGASNIVIDGCTFEGTFANGGAAIAFADQSRPGGFTGNVTVKNCTFNTVNSYYDVYGYYCGNSINGYGDFVIENNVFKSQRTQGKPVYLGRYASSTPVVVAGNTFETAANLDAAVYVQDHSNYGVSVAASNNTFAN